jgi:hypothetical protein
MVSLCCQISLLCCATAMLIFFIAGLLYLLCFEHVDNLGAYTASRPETGLLIPAYFGVWCLANSAGVNLLPWT